MLVGALSNPLFAESSAPAEKARESLESVTRLNKEQAERASDIAGLGAMSLAFNVGGGVAIFRAFALPDTDLSLPIGGVLLGVSAIAWLTSTVFQWEFNRVQVRITSALIAQASDTAETNPNSAEIVP